MKPARPATHRVIELVLLGLVSLVVFSEGLRFVTTLRHSVGAMEAGVYLIFLAAFLALLLFVYGFQPRTIQESTAVEDRRMDGARNVLICMGLFFGFVLMLGYVDYTIATFVFFAAYLRIFGRYRWPVIILGSALASVGSAYLWHILGVAMPQRAFIIF